MNITQFTMEEVRCFAERQEFNIRPLTFLVGENSTGKTTALACFQVLAFYLMRGEINFNLPPYSMGVFRDIVRNSRKPDKAFRLGFGLKDESEAIECIVEFVERKEGGEPVVGSITVKFADGEIVARASNIAGARLTFLDKERNRYYIDVNFRALGFNLFSSLVDRFHTARGGCPEDRKAFEDYFSSKRVWSTIGDVPPIFDISPIRSRPERTYNPTGIAYDPEGSKVPEWLMWIKATRKKDWESLKTRLVDFGKRSGMFQNIDVRNFGRAVHNPFQLKFRVRGPNSNITEVGYGVSQILPILVYILNPDISGQKLFCLLQQPEVHLHPRAQAELSSLLVTTASQGGATFIIETHSDYMIDRARIEIKKGNIRPEDVSLIYLEPKGRVVKVHNISFDKMANMEGVPPHYGEFFLKEYRQLMGFED